MSNISQFVESLGLKFNNVIYLQHALTHPSVKKNRKASHFERLEFLGDRILGLVIAESLYHSFPKEKEGSLAKRLAALVNRDVCIDIAQQIKLDTYLEVTGTKLGYDSSVLADAMEALIGAIYLDQGLNYARDFILRYWKKWLDLSISPPKDNKTALQEWSQKHGFGIPKYHVIDIQGPAHSPLFTISVALNSYQAEAQGTSRRAAEQSAARILLERLEK
ncbi:MAG TPA: ribonuclease III [Candidatus Nitrosotenuis sp.]|jgi:ribonuclease-3|nr:ribonuclease III [Candidatus Nitrosotenuis sp.]